MRIAAVVLCTIATLLAGAAPKTALGDNIADRVALDAAIQAWKAAFISRDADAMLALTSDDVVLLPPNAAPVRGRDSAQAYWSQFRSPDVVTISLSIEETAIDGDIAYSMGSFSESLPNETIAGYGLFIAIWKRINGEWRVHRHMFSDGTTRHKGLAPEPVPDQPMLDTPDTPDTPDPQ